MVDLAGLRQSLVESVVLRSRVVAYTLSLRPSCDVDPTASNTPMSVGSPIRMVMAATKRFKPCLGLGPKVRNASFHHLLHFQSAIGSLLYSTDAETRAFLRSLSLFSSG
jgi:hypothetical protein